MELKDEIKNVDKQSISIIKEILPNITSDEQIAYALLSHGGDVERTIEYLLTQDVEENSKLFIQEEETHDELHVEEKNFIKWMRDMHKDFKQISLEKLSQTQREKLFEDFLKNQNQKKEMEKDVKRKSQASPIFKLPEELMFYIFSFLEVDEVLEPRLVCYSWYDVIMNKTLLRSFFREISYEKLLFRLSPAFKDKIIAPNSSGVQEIDFRGYDLNLEMQEDVRDDNIVFLYKLLKNAKELRVFRIEKMSPFIAEMLALYSPKLQEIWLDNLTDIESLTKVFTHLKELKCVHYFNATSHTLSVICKQPSCNLETVSIAMKENFMDPQSFIQFIDKCSNTLKTLFIMDHLLYECNYLDANAIAEYRKNQGKQHGNYLMLPKLEEFAATGTVCVFKIPNVKKLVLYLSPNKKNNKIDELELWLSECKKLEELTIFVDSPRELLTLTPLIPILRRLKKLNLNCLNSFGSSITKFLNLIFDAKNDKPHLNTEFEIYLTLVSFLYDSSEGLIDVQDRSEHLIPIITTCGKHLKGLRVWTEMNIDTINEKTFLTWFSKESIFWKNTLELDELDSSSEKLFKTIATAFKNVPEVCLANCSVNTLRTFLKVIPEMNLKSIHIRMESAEMPVFLEAITGHLKYATSRLKLKNAKRQSTNLISSDTEESSSDEEDDLVPRLQEFRMPTGVTPELKFTSVLNSHLIQLIGFLYPNAERLHFVNTGNSAITRDEMHDIINALKIFPNLKELYINAEFENAGECVEHVVRKLKSIKKIRVKSLNENDFTLRRVKRIRYLNPSLDFGIFVNEL